MRYVDEFRTPRLVGALAERIADVVRGAPSLFSDTKPVQIMEVCGGHTHAIFRFGLDKLLPSGIEFIHGPGCPVCVLPVERIDTCCEIAARADVILCTYGDALRVPGSRRTLSDVSALGGDIRMICSPWDAMKIAVDNPDKQVVFFALGFETTLPATAVTLQHARRIRLTNFSIFCQHINLIPALRSLLKLPDIHIDGFLAPGHVSMITGTLPFEFIPREYDKPVVVAGFEPLDILQGVLMIIQQLHRRESHTDNQYRRVAPDEGNILARRATDDVFSVAGDSEWRGLGQVEGSGVRLRSAYADFDAESRFRPGNLIKTDGLEGRCADVLTGRCKPVDCLFAGRSCTPATPVGALMVSPEGACAAWYLYRRGPEDTVR